MNFNSNVVIACARRRTVKQVLIMILFASSILLSTAVIVLSATASDNKHDFPSDFRFGLATAAYQIEGAWKLNGKGENIWDHLCHTQPDIILNKDNGDVACDAYHKTKEDVKLLSDMKVDFYRLSLSWSRLMPNGLSYKVNPDGVRYYNELIDALVENNITPMVTLYHWDLPQKLQELGGWANPLIVDWFVDYADVVFKLFGDRVKEWVTMNEANQVCQQGYAEGTMAPAYRNEEIGGYLCAHHLILAHAKAYRLYEKEYKHKQKGRVGFTLDNVWPEPKTNSSEDLAAAKRAIDMNFNWYGHPIFSAAGDYPKILRERVDRFSKEEGFPRSRLPKFTPEEVQLVRGSYDFVGFNHYTSKLVSDGLDPSSTQRPSHNFDVGVKYDVDPNWPPTAASWFYVNPEGIRKTLEWIKREWNDPEVIITENGYADPDTSDLNDCNRIRYYNEYLQEVLKAIHESGVRVTAYTAWSFLDNFEWMSGYTQRFGLYYVNYTDPQRERIPKMSSHVFRNIIETKKIDWSFTPDGFPQCQWN